MISSVWRLAFFYTLIYLYLRLSLCEGLKAGNCLPQQSQKPRLSVTLEIFHEIMYKTIPPCEEGRRWDFPSQISVWSNEGGLYSWQPAIICMNMCFSLCVLERFNSNCVIWKVTERIYSGAGLKQNLEEIVLQLSISMLYYIILLLKKEVLNILLLAFNWPVWFSVIHLTLSLYLPLCVLHLAKSKYPHRRQSILRIYGKMAVILIFIRSENRCLFSLPDEAQTVIKTL